jgi:hypothetical protein
LAEITCGVRTGIDGYKGGVDRSGRRAHEHVRNDTAFQENLEGSHLQWAPISSSAEHKGKHLILTE